MRQRRRKIIVPTPDVGPHGGDDARTCLSCRHVGKMAEDAMQVMRCEMHGCSTQRAMKDPTRCGMDRRHYEQRTP